MGRRRLRGLLSRNFQFEFKNAGQLVWKPQLSNFESQATFCTRTRYQVCLCCTAVAELEPLYWLDRWYLCLHHAWIYFGNNYGQAQKALGMSRKQLNLGVPYSNAMTTSYSSNEALSVCRVRGGMTVALSRERSNPQALRPPQREKTMSTFRYLGKRDVEVVLVCGSNYLYGNRLPGIYMFRLFFIRIFVRTRPLPSCRCTEVVLYLVYCCSLIRSILLWVPGYLVIPWYRVDDTGKPGVDGPL